jgi:hypothetical protein
VKRGLLHALQETTPSALQKTVTTDSQLVVQSVFKDIFGDTVPRGDKIYAIRAPAPTSSPEILAAAEHRTVGIVFNWCKQVGFNRAGDNSCAFVFRPKVKGTYGDLASAYRAAEEFLALPSVHEGPLLDETPAEETPSKNVFVYLYQLLVTFLKNLPITSKFVLASIVLSGFLILTYSTVLYLQEYTGCVAHSSFDFHPAFNTLCNELLELQLHVRRHSIRYMEMFFTQLKIGFVLSVKHILDHMFL